MKPNLTCLSIDCPERKSICCGAISKAVSGDEGTGYYVCSKCSNEYIGGKCTSGNGLPTNEEILKRMQGSKKIQNSLKTLGRLSKKYKMTIRFGNEEITL